MRRLAAVLFLILGIAVIGGRGSQAQGISGQDVVQINGYCFLPPYNTLTPCPVSATPTLSLPTPMKLLNVGAANPGPNDTTSWDIQITSKSACTPLNEPILLYTLGKPGVGAFTQFYPQYSPSTGAPVTVQVDQRLESPLSGQANLTLEVYNPQVGPAGLDVKAVWPEEGVERVANIIAPASPTATTTLLPGQPTNTAAPGTPVITDTPVATSTSTPTGTLPATAAPTPFPTPGPGKLTVRACVIPQVLNGHSLGGDDATLYGQTVPGALCFPTVHFSSGGGPVDDTFLLQSATGEVADANGLVGFSFHEDVDGSYGVASVTCTAGGQSQTGYAYFFIRQTVPPGPSPGGVCPPNPASGSGPEAAAAVNQLNPPDGSNVTVSACFSVDGVGIPNIPMMAVYHFLRGDGFCTATTDAGGNASCTQNIGNALPGYPVVVEVIFTYNGQTYIAVSEFTPACGAGTCTSGVTPGGLALSRRGLNR